MYTEDESKSAYQYTCILGYHTNTWHVFNWLLFWQLHWQLSRYWQTIDRGFKVLVHHLIKSFKYMHVLWICRLINTWIVWHDEGRNRILLSIWCTVMSACSHCTCGIPFHRVFEICKTSFYLTRHIRKCDNHTVFSHYTQYVRHNHSIDIQCDMQHKSRYTPAIYVERSILQF